MPNTRENTTREMTFEEEAVWYEKEARAEFAKETGNGDCSTVNGILRRGMRIIRKARKEIANGVTVQKWIPVTERLPEEDIRVLVWVGENNCYFPTIDTDRLHETRWVRWNEYITHWMPLPPAPKGE